MIAQRHAVVYFHGLNRRAYIFDGAVIQAFGAKLAQHVQGDIFGPDARLQTALENHSHRFRDAQPHLASGHDGAHIGAFNACAKRVESAVSDRMGVGADNQITTREVSAFRQNLVANAIANVVQNTAVLVGKLAHGGVPLRSLDGGRW